MHRTPVDGSPDTGDLPFVNCFDEQLQVLERSRRQHAVPEVEDVARTSTSPAKHVPDALADQSGRAQEHSWIKVALNPPILADAGPAGVERYPPVERHDIRAGC